LFLLGGVAAVAMGVGAVLLWRGADDAPGTGITIAERLEALKAERASLQARADGLARLDLAGPLRLASLLSDALAVRGGGQGERNPEKMPAPMRQAFADLEALNEALRDALARPGSGATLAARAAARRAETALDQLAPGNDLPIVLAYTPRFVPPRRSTGEMMLAVPRAVAPPQGAGEVHFEAKANRSEGAGTPTVPRYAPDFAAQAEDDPPVIVEVVGLNLSRHSPPALTIGNWRGTAAATIGERVRFSVPRAAFPTAALRTTLVRGLLAVRRDNRTVTFELPLIVLPDRPGSMAFDQKVRTTVSESNTLVSPEILSRGEAGETRTVHRCFDPPEGWQFDKENRRVVVVERLAWVDDVSDPTMNAGTVELVPEDKPGQICLNVVTRAATKNARTATIGRFEATLTRDRAEKRSLRSGVRALDWREPVRVPIDASAVEWKLYVRLFDEIDREFNGKIEDMPFVHVALEPGRIGSGKVLVLRADPGAEP